MFIEVEGNKTCCLLDSGSQVTVISEKYYNSKLSHIPLQKLEIPLTVTGAGGQPVPYQGMILISCTLPESVAGKLETVKVAALVGRDNLLADKVPIILGTNVFRDVQCTKWADQVIRGEATFMMAHCVDYSHPDGKVGHIKLRGRNVVVPPLGTVTVRGQASIQQIRTCSEVLVQEPINSVLPEGLGVIASKVDMGALYGMCVTLCNFTEQEIVVKKKSVIADVLVINAMYDVQNVLSDLHNVQQEPSCGAKVIADPSPSDPISPKSDSRCSSLKFRFGENTSPEWQEHFTGRLKEFDSVFVQNKVDLGHTSGITHDIQLEAGTCVRERPRPIPPKDFEDARQHIQQLLDAKIITPSSSPYASPIVLVRKKNGALRMCVDYRKINMHTLKDSYAIPKIEDMFLTLNGAKFFTSVDLSQAYYQVPMTERAKLISAFTTPFGLYQFERMAMGLKNAPHTFQRLMEKVFSDMNLTELIVFLDDILIHGRTLTELEDRTVEVLTRLKKYNLKLDPEKCIFGASEVRHLGHIISDAGIKPDPDKIKSLTTWPKPRTVKDVKSFVGFAGYYRRFIPQFADIAKPLNDLTVGYVPRGSQKKGGKPGTLHLTSDISRFWGESQQKAFDTLIQALTSDPIIALADRGKPFKLHCDASGTGIGAVLYQEQEGKLRVIAYASRSLNKTERNYPAHKREFLALKWAMTEKFHDYILGAQVTVVTDNNPLCYILRNAKLDATSHRWLTSLSIYDFDLQYKKGSTHVDADALSRRHEDEPGEEDGEYQKLLEDTKFLREKAERFEQQSAQMIYVNASAIRAVMTAKGVNKRPDTESGRLGDKEGATDLEFVPAVEQTFGDPSLIRDDILEPKEEGSNTISTQDWRKYQLADPTLAWVIENIVRGAKLESNNGATHEQKVFIKDQGKFVLRDGVLYRRILDEETGEEFQLVIPVSHRQMAMRGVHDDLFHTHLDSALKQARMRFYWPFMARDLERKIKKCGRCLRRGAPAQKAPMQSISTTFPLELLSIDFLTIEVKGQKQNVLVMLDHFTKFALAVCTRDQTARTVARVLWQEFFLVYGFPKRILTDQGRDFESRLVKEVCAIAGIQKCRTTPYHPQGNPVERWNRTLLNMIRSLEDEKKVDWRTSLPAVVHAYNSCVHSSTGYSPYFLFFGRHPRLPIDLAFGIDLEKNTKETPRQYVQKLKTQLKTAYTTAVENMQKAAKRNKARYDQPARAVELEVGDRCLVRRLGPKLSSKVSDKWESAVYVIISQHDDIPVYTVQEESGKGPLRTLHRNYLLPIGVLDEETSSNSKPCAKDTSAIKRREPPEAVSESSEAEDDESDFKAMIYMRPEAPEFVPKGQMDKAAVHIFSDGKTPPKDTDTDQARLQENPPSEDESEKGSSDDDSEEDAAVSGVDRANSSESDSNRDFESEGDLSDHDSVPVTPRVSPVPPPRPPVPLRRSLRTPKPVERLNLAHHCRVRETWLDTSLTEAVIQRLHILMDQTISDTRAVVLEDLLYRIISV